MLYLTVVSWFDDRREKDDRQKFNQSVATRYAHHLPCCSHADVQGIALTGRCGKHVLLIGGCTCTGERLARRRAASQRPQGSQYQREVAARASVADAAIVKLQTCFRRLDCVMMLALKLLEHQPNDRNLVH